MKPPAVTSFHTILFSRDWEACVSFYQDLLGFPVTAQKAGFMEFRVTPSARIGLLKETRRRDPHEREERYILSFRVPDVRETHRELASRGLELPTVRKHPWGDWVLECTDPEGRRLEFWTPGEAHPDIG